MATDCRTWLMVSMATKTEISDRMKMFYNKMKHYVAKKLYLSKCNLEWKMDKDAIKFVFSIAEFLKYIKKKNKTNKTHKRKKRNCFQTAADFCFLEIR